MAAAISYAVPRLRQVTQLDDALRERLQVRVLERVQNAGPQIRFGASVSAELPLDLRPRPLGLLPKTVHRHGEIIFNKQPRKTRHYEAEGDPAALHIVFFPALDVLENGPPGESGFGTVRIGLFDPGIEIPVQHDGGALAGKEHDAPAQLRREAGPRHQRIHDEEPCAAPITAQSHGEGPRNSTMQRGRAFIVTKHPGNTRVPSALERLQCEETSRPVTGEIQNHMRMYEPRPVFIDPDHGGAIRTGDAGDVDEVLQKCCPPRICLA